MVEDEDEGVGVFGGFDELGADKRAGREVEGGVGRFPDDVRQPVRRRAEALLFVLLFGQVGVTENDIPFRFDCLDRAAVRFFEHRAEGGVAGDEVAEGFFQGGAVERALELADDADMVEGVPGLELLEDVEPLLGVREGVVGGLRSLGDGGKSRDGGGLIESVCQVFEKRVLEEEPKREFPLERVLDPAHNPDRLEGVASELEEVIVPADPLEPEDLLPDTREEGLGFGLRFFVLPGPAVGLGRSREGRAVELTVRGEGEGIEMDESGRDHVLGERLFERGPESIGREGRLRLGPVVGGEVGVGPRLIPEEDDGVGDAGDPFGERFRSHPVRCGSRGA